MILVRGKSVSIVLALLCLVCVPGLVTPFNEEVEMADQKKVEEGSFIVESPDSKFTSVVKLAPSGIRALKKKHKKTTKKTKNAKKTKKKKDNKEKAPAPSGSTDFDPANEFFATFGPPSNPCGNGVIEEEGELHSADKGYDHYCLYHCGDSVCSDREGSCHRGDERIWYRCSGGQIINKRSRQCLQYDDNWPTWDEVKVRDCDNGNDQKFDKYVTRTRKVKDAPTDASARTEFKLKARSGSDHCVSSRDCYPAGAGCWVGADYCNDGLKYYFFMKSIDRSRFDYPHTGYYPYFFDEAHDALVAMWIMYDLSRIRFDLRLDGNTNYLNGTDTDLEEVFFQSGTAPSKGNVTLQQILNVLDVAKLPSEMSIHNWLNIWDETKLKNTSLHFFNDKLPTFDRERVGSPLAYGIFVEQDEKRITVSLKGSNGEDNPRGNYFKDWSKKNAECDFVQWKYPDGGCIGLDNRCPYVHKGWANVVDANYEFIKGKLMELSETFPTYKVYIIGHSMGGATAQLLGFRLASEYNRGMIPNNKLPMPINIITAASPQVANSDFQDIHVILERAGLLRNLRLRNRKDWAPISVGGCENPGSTVGCSVYCSSDPLNRARAVGVELDLDLHDESFNWVYYHPVATDYQRKLESTNSIDRLLLDRPFTAPDRPYHFLDVDCGGDCNVYWHNCDSHMLSLIILLKGRIIKLNDEYEKHLGR